MMKNVFFLLAIVACFFASCSEGDEPVAPTQKPELNTPDITLDSSIQTSGLSFDTATSEKSITFTSTTDWTLSIAETRSGTSWCTAFPTSGGKGTATVKFTTTENTEPEDRSVAVTIKGGATSKTFTVTQKGNKSLLVTTKKYELPKEGGEIEIEVKSNVEYEMEISETAKDWISENTGRGITAHKHIFNVTPSEEATKREGEIIFKSGDIVEIVKIYQAGEPTIVLSKNEFTVSDAGETISVDIKSNVEFGVQMPNVDWIKEDATGRGMSSHTLKFVVATNESYDARNVNIIFYDKNSELKDTLKIIQVQRNVIALSKKEYHVKAEGEIIKVELKSNIDFEISIENDWINQISSRNISEYILNFDISENKTLEERIGQICIKTKNNECKIITITQEAGEMALTLNVQEAGSLSSLIASSKLYEISKLTITGFLNGSDINLIRKMAGCSVLPVGHVDKTGKLRTLDISNAHIVNGGSAYAYEKTDAAIKYVIDKVYYTEDNTITPFMFTDCGRLKTLFLPNSVTRIEKNAFYDHYELERITLPKSLEKFDDAFKSYYLKEIFIDENNNYFTIKNGVFYTKDMTKLICYPGSNEIFKNNFSVPNGVKIIAPYAFCSLDYVDNIILPQSIEEIGKHAFIESKIKEMIIKPNIKYEKLGKNTQIDNVIIEDGFETFDGSIFESSIYSIDVVSVNTIKIYCKIPPKIETQWNVFNKFITNKCKLLVPKDSYNDYYTAYGWGDFKNIEINKE